ncbi:MAG: hemerythrin family protein [Halanaerobiaceae bacterium]|jgi:hemerythrin|nr:hemerythrin family protein [Halanaerobiaceae bacterium]
MIWKEKYRIGVELIDRQHRELFERVNGFIKVVRSGQSMEEKLEEIEKTFSFMGEYVVVHFESEEAVQRKYEFPEYERHKKIHDDFRNDVKKFKSKFENDKYNEELVQEFSGRLLTWLINHVTGEDQKISEYVKRGEK